MAIPSECRQVNVLDDARKGRAFKDAKACFRGKTTATGIVVAEIMPGNGETIFDLVGGLWMGRTTKTRMNIAALMVATGRSDIQPNR